MRYLQSPSEPGEGELMKVTIIRRWPDGDALSIEIKAESNYPDAMAEAKRTALDAYREALGVTTQDVE